MAIQGVRLTDNFVTDQRPKDWREGILLLFPNGKAPLFALTAGMKKRVAEDPEFNWWEKSMESQRVALTANMVTATTDITVGQTSSINNGLIAGWKNGTLLRVEETNEVLRVTVDPVSGNGTVTVLRSIGATAATQVLFAGAGVNPNLQGIGSSHGENSSAPTGVNFDPVKSTNFTQIFRDTLEMSRTAQKTRLRTGDQVREAKRETLQLHSEGIERSFWFGEKSEVLTGNPIRTTEGIDSYMRTNASGNIVSATSGTFTYAEFEDFMEQAFRFGSSEKMAFCGNQALLAINRAVRLSTNASINIDHGQREFGMNVSRLTSPFGTVVLKSHPLFNQVTGGATGGSDYFATNATMYILDMENMVYRFLRDSDTKFQSKLEANDLDGMQSGYLTECALELHHPTTHFIIRDMNTATAG